MPENYTYKEIADLRQAVILELVGEWNAKAPEVKATEDWLSPVAVEERLRTYILAGLKAKDIG